MKKGYPIQQYLGENDIFPIDVCKTTIPFYDVQFGFKGTVISKQIFCIFGLKEDKEYIKTQVSLIRYAICQWLLSGHLGFLEYALDNKTSTLCIFIEKMEEGFTIWPFWNQVVGDKPLVSVKLTESLATLSFYDKDGKKTSFLIASIQTEVELFLDSLLMTNFWQHSCSFGKETKGISLTEVEILGRVYGERAPFGGYELRHQFARIEDGDVFFKLGNISFNIPYHGLFLMSNKDNWKEQRILNLVGMMMFLNSILYNFKKQFGKPVFITDRNLDTSSCSIEGTALFSDGLNETFEIKYN